MDDGGVKSVANPEFVFAVNFSVSVSVKNSTRFVLSVNVEFKPCVFVFSNPLFISGFELVFDFEILSRDLLDTKIKNEIVSIGNKLANPQQIVGEYIQPKDWNNLISQEDVLVLDTRNTYEYSIGTFKNSIQPQTTNFREFPEWVEQLESSNNNNKDQKIAMFCTGGIRCEKASSLLKAKGFHNVHHLKGGILGYMDQIDGSESLWEGECFVFDDRVALNHKLEVGSFDMCHGCRMPITESDKLSEQFQKGISCPNCFDKKTAEQKRRYAERIKQIDLAKQRNENHLGAKSS